MPLVTANVLQPIINVFEQVLLFFHDTVGVGWGLSIIFLTLTVRAVLLPLTFKQFKSMAAMQKLTPEIKKLRDKYGDDKQRLNQETMKFYQENKVNPFASCLPLVAQMPVFISLFYMLRKDLKEDICPAITQKSGDLATNYCDSVQHGVAKFLFIPDITAPGKGGVLAALIVLYVGSQLLSSALMATSIDPNQRKIMLALPFIFVFFILRFPTGLIVYWITTNFWTVGQQYFVRRAVGMSVPGRPGTLPKQEPMDFGKLFGAKKDEEAPPSNGKPMAKAAGNGNGNGNGAKATNGAGAAGRAVPPPSPRKKKKKTGRRR